jgi:hypothetical protein
MIVTAAGSDAKQEGTGKSTGFDLAAGRITPVVDQGRTGLTGFPIQMPLGMDLKRNTSLEHAAAEPERFRSEKATNRTWLPGF